MPTKVPEQRNITFNNQPVEGIGDKNMRYETLVIDGVEYVTTYTKKYTNRKKWINPDKKKVYSSIPGTICEVFVKPGSKVSQGERMLILEAMKMMNNIDIPHDGEIKKVHVEVGDRIPKGKLMVEYK
jgi:biotin carboxyl carrier protein